MLHLPRCTGVIPAFKVPAVKGVQHPVIGPCENGEFTSSPSAVERFVGFVSVEEMVVLKGVFR